MTTLTIEIPEKVEKALTDLIAQLGGKVVVIDSKGKREKNVKEDKEKLSRKEREFIKGFEESIEFIKLHQAGKVQAKTIDQLLNEL